jgi:hypothetical protein
MPPETEIDNLPIERIREIIISLDIKSALTLRVLTNADRAQELIPDAQQNIVQRTLGSITALIK